MHAISASEAARTLPSLVERVVDDHDAVEIVSDRGNAVLLPADEYASWQETEYLFRSRPTPVDFSMPTTGPARDREGAEP